MTSNTGNPFSQCLCCVECQDNAKDFQKIVDLKNIGLIIYRHMMKIQDKKMGTDAAAKVVEETFIIENTNDQDITSSQYFPEIDQNKISCLRCRKIFEHAQRLLQTIPNLDKNVVRGICDHCLMEQKSCYECEQVIQKFLSKAKELPENTKSIIKQWLSKVKNVLKSIDVDDYNIKDSRLKKSRTISDLYVDRLLIKSPQQSRERYLKQLFLPQTPLTQKKNADNRIVFLEKGQAVGQPVTDAHLKEKRLKIFESIPPVPITSKQELLERSFEQVEPSTRPKSSHYKNIIMKPDDMDQLFGADYKKNQEHSLKKYNSDESLLTIAEKIRKTDAKMGKDFSYFFPKKKKYVYPKRYASSSELIKETQDILQEKAEAERKQREMKVLRKLDIQEKKKKARAERKAREKEKSSKEPYRREDGTFRHLTPMGQSSSTVGVHKRDDKSHKIRDITPSKTANFEIDKDERHAKGDISKGKTGYAKTDGEKDIREDQKEDEGRQGKEQKHREKDEREKPGKGKVDERQPKEQRQRDKEGREQSGKGKVDERTPKGQGQRDKEEREKPGKEKVDERTPKELKQKDKEEREKSGKGKVDGSTPKEQKQRNKEEKEKSGKEKVDGSTPKEQRQRDKEEKEKSGKGKLDERLSKEQKLKEDKVKSPGQLREVEQKTKDKKGEEKQMQPDKLQKEKKETVLKSTETPAKEKKQKGEKENTKQDKEQDEKGESKSNKEQQLKQDKEGKEKTTKEKEGELNQGPEKIQRDARETKDTISAKAQEALLGLGQEKQKKEKETKQEKVEKEKYAADSSANQKAKKAHRDHEQKEVKEPTSKKEEELSQEIKKVERDAREAKDMISAKAQAALLGQIKQQKDKEPKQEREKRESKSGSGKTASGKSKKSKREKSPKKKMPKEETEKPSEEDIAPKSKHAKRNLSQPEPKEKDLAINKIKVRRASPDDMILRLVRLKQTERAAAKPVAKQELGVLKALGNKLKRQHKPHKSLNIKCLMCIESDLEFDLDSLLNEKKAPKFEEIIIGSKIYKYTPPFLGHTMEGIEPSTIPQLFRSNFEEDDKIDDAIVLPLPLPPSAEKAGAGGQKILQKNNTELKKTGKQTKMSPSAELEASKGIVHYTLSDRSFIEKGWTMLPTEKVVRKMNVYRMRPAQPEFDWFEHNRSKGQMTYDTGEVLAEFDDNGRGRWFYRNGRLALDYYDAEEMNASQRFVIWSSGEPDERGRTQPYTILATFDYLGNGIVFDHSGKIRLKYNQTEGIILDRKIGPVSHWKWHTLNDPPVLQQVMIDTHMSHKDETILKLGSVDDDKSRPDNDDMLAIEFDNFIKEKSKKLTQSFKPFQIKMKALKINENFSLKVMDQASVYLIYRDGTTNMKMNMGMILDHKEIVDTDTAEVGEVSNNIERLPAKTDSLAGLQKSIAYAQCFERMRSARERRLRLPQAVASADRMTAAASRPLRPPLRSIPSDTSTSISAVTRTGCSYSRKPTKSNIYYDSRLF